MSKYEKNIISKLSVKRNFYLNMNIRHQLNNQLNLFKNANRKYIFLKVNRDEIIKQH